MKTTLLHVVSTTASSHDHSQARPHPVTHAVRGGEGRGRGKGGEGMITTLFHAASTTTSPVTHVRGGEGEGGGRGGV